jgi:hypothetical protein
MNDDTEDGGQEPPSADQTATPSEPAQAEPEEPQFPQIKFLLETYNSKRSDDAEPSEDKPE